MLKILRLDMVDAKSSSSQKFGIYVVTSFLMYFIQSHSAGQISFDITRVNIILSSDLYHFNNNW